MSNSPAYVVNSDFENYVEGWTTNDAAALTRLLARAETYIDFVCAGRRLVGADAVQSISTTGGATGGSFTMQWLTLWGTLTSGVIPYNANYGALTAALAVAFNVGGSTPYTVQTAAMPQRLQNSLVEPPLPNPIVFSFIGALGSQPIPAATVASNGLTGGSSPAPECTVICPGDYDGHRLNPSELLNRGQLQRVKNAVCAQAEYMIQMGTNFFVEAEYSSVKGPDFWTTGTRPKVSPKARRELAIAGLTNMARAKA